MGGESSSLNSCELDASCEISSSVPWTLHAVNGYDGVRLSAFVYDIEKVGKDVIDTSIKNLKTLKHPGIVKYFGTRDNKKETWILTEYVCPLELVIDSLAVEEISAGLLTIIQVLSFLHQAGLCHNNVSLSSIFVTLDGNWKLGGLEWMCHFNDVTPSLLAEAATYRSKQAVAPEEKDKNFSPMDNPGYVRDVYAFGNLAEQLLEFMTSMDDVTKTFEQMVTNECSHSDPKQRPQLASLQEDQLFKNNYVDIVQFLKNLTVQTENDKEEFFRSVVEKLFTLPISLVATRLVRPLLARFVLLEKCANEHLLPHLLTPAKGLERQKKFVAGELNPLLPEPVYAKYIIPEIFKIFHVRDSHIRITLLYHFSSYVPYFDKNILRTTMLPQVLLGIRDTNDELVKLSLKALSEMVPALGGDVVIGIHRMKIFSQGVPKAAKNIKENGVGPLSTVEESQSSPRPKLTALEERERKRQEAKKRVEEKRKKRQQEKLLKQTAIINLESDDGGPADINRSQATENNITPADNTPSSEHSKNGESENKQIDLETHITAENESEPTNTLLKTMLDQAEDHPCDKQSSDVTITDSDMEAEIERELQAMEELENSTTIYETRQKVYSDAKQKTLASSSDIIHVDWSDVTSATNKMADGNESINKLSSKGRGALKLSPRKIGDTSVTNSSIFTQDSQSTGNAISTETSNARAVSAAPSPRKSSMSDNTGFREQEVSNWGEDNEDDWEDTEWDAIEETQSNLSKSNASCNAISFNNLNINSTSRNANSKKATTHTNLKSPKLKTANEPLGAEFDIMALDMKGIKGLGGGEVDYFADMVPKLNQPKADSLFSALGLVNPSGSSKEMSKNIGKGTDKFAVVQDTGDMESGWDDVEWGDS